jgi:hypothetical protein
MAELQVPEVLFLRPSRTTKSATAEVSIPAESRELDLSTGRPVRSVREVMNELRSVARVRQFPEVSHTSAINSGRYVLIDQQSVGSHGPHFRGSTTKESVAPSVAFDQVTREPHIPPLQWSEIVTTFVRHNRAQMAAVLEITQKNHRIGLIGLEPSCGTTTIASALAVSIQADRDGRPDQQVVNQFGPTVLIDANLAQPSLASIVSKSHSVSWTEWTTLSIEQTSQQLDRIVATLPGGDSLKLWPLTCGISDSSIVDSVDRVASENGDSAIRYFLPSQAAGPIAQVLGRVVERLHRGRNVVLADLGHLGFWRRLQHLSTIARLFDQLIVVIPTNSDRRTISQAIWELQELGQRSCLLLENPGQFGD